MRYKRKGKVSSKENLADLTSLQKWILTRQDLENWRDFGSVLNLCKPYQSSDGRQIQATNVQVGRALRNLVSKGLLERSR